MTCIVCDRQLIEAEQPDVLWPLNSMCHQCRKITAHLIEWAGETESGDYTRLIQSADIVVERMRKELLT